MSAHRIEVVRRSPDRSIWVARCSCGWLTFGLPRREDGRIAAREHRQ